VKQRRQWRVRHQRRADGAVAVQPTSASAGTPALCSSATIAAPMPGVCSAGLAATALPATSAATTCPVKMASGKFHG
jgi:hypothetical protein